MRTRQVIAIVVAMFVGTWLCVTVNAQGPMLQQTREALSERIQDLNLTDDQEAKISGIRKEYRPKVEESAKQLATLVREEVEKVRALLTVEQIDKLAAMKEMREERRAESLAERIAHLEDLDLTAAETAKITEIRAEYRPKIVEALEGLKGLLTEEQRNAWKESREAGKNRREVAASLKLTDEQKEKVMAAGKEVRSLVREQLEEIRDVLSDEQQEKLGEMKEERRANIRDRLAAAIANGKDLNLTDEQKSQIASVRQEYRPKIQAAGKELRAAVRDEIAAIVAVLKG